VGIKITSKNRNDRKIVNKNPDTQMNEEDLSVYFSHWLDKIPSWKATRKTVKLLDNVNYSLTKIWSQASRRLYSEPGIIERLRKGEIFKFSIEFTIKQNIPPKWKKYCISLCPVCKKGVNIHLSRAVKYCPNCAQKTKMDNQRLRRAIKQNQHFCKTCGKPLPKKYPNRNNCNQTAMKL